MNPFGARSAIVAAERQLMQARGEVRESVDRVRSALRSTLRQPTSLFIATGVGLLTGAWFARRNKSPVATPGPASTPLPDWASALLIRVGLQRLVAAWQRVRAVDPQHPPVARPQKL